MVGVPGRSKGCNTCRRRRVKCDETKPVCVRCTKGGFECGGYQRNRVWHNSSTAPLPETNISTHPLLTPSVHMKVLLSSSPYVSANSTPNSKRVTQSLWQTIEMPPRVDIGASKTQSTHTDNQVHSPPRELSLVAFKGEFCFSFMLSNFVWRVYGTPWLEQAANGKLGVLPLDAAKALAEANFGRSNHQTDLEVQGMTLYGKSLKSLASSLAGNDGNGGQPRDLLVTILLLLMQSASNSDRAGSASHLRGIARLLYVSGPEAFQEQPHLNAFEAARATLLLASLVSRQRLFLEEEKWLTIPWARNKVYKTPQSELIDILMTIPGVLEDHAARLADLGSSTVIDTLDLAVKVQNQLVDLFLWRWRWQLASGHLVGEEIIETGNDGTDQLGSLGTSKQNRRLRFGRFTAATELMIYNATLMWLMALLWKLDPFGAAQRIDACAAMASASFDNAEFGSFAPLRRPGGALSVTDPAMEICQAFEWVSRHHSLGKEPTHLYLFPVGMAITVLEEAGDASEGGAWARQLLDASPITANYAKASNPAGFGFYLTSECLNPEEVQAQQRLFITQTMS